MPKKLSQYFGYDNRCLNIEKMSLLWLVAPEALSICGSRKVQKTVPKYKCPKEWPNVTRKLSLKRCIKQNLQSVQKGIVGQSPSVSRRLPPHPHLGQVSPISVNNLVQIFIKKYKTNIHEGRQKQTKSASWPDLFDVQQLA